MNEKKGLRIWDESRYETIPDAPCIVLIIILSLFKVLERSSSLHPSECSQIPSHHHCTHAPTEIRPSPTGEDDDPTPFRIMVHQVYVSVP